MIIQKITETDLKILGRHVINNDILYLSYSASSIEFFFTGTHLSARIRTDRADDDIQRGYLGVFVNGTFTKKIMLDKPEADYDVFDQAEYTYSDKAVPVIRIMRFSESNFGKAGLISVTHDGEIKRTPDKSLKIEFIGDSITCGYGVEGVFMKETFSTATENPYRAYSMKTVNALDADFSFCAWSGNGIVTTWIPPERDIPDTSVPLMPVVYRYTDIAGALFQCVNPAPQYDFDSFQPDIVVVNLGTNDQSYTRFKEDRVADFGTRYGEFIRFVRSKRPNALIVGCLGVMGQDLCDEEEKQFMLLKDTKAHFLRIDEQKEEDGIGIDSHPSETTHTKFAERLVSFIKEKLV